ncbi:hypothetical protein A3Q56_04620 [Intoshia linei]|uniref:Uncharacterized protein n=1 Tax=Intoshia linei TaxID=1819745 RepID=A0A177B060_9BILA|nr:hypothetical protein A3Q56_04620 [Intoshia linei]
MFMISSWNFHVYIQVKFNLNSFKYFLTHNKRKNMTDQENNMPNNDENDTPIKDVNELLKAECLENDENIQKLTETVQNSVDKIQGKFDETFNRIMEKNILLIILLFFKVQKNIFLISLNYAMDMMNQKISVLENDLNNMIDTKPDGKDACNNVEIENHAQN